MTEDGVTRRTVPTPDGGWLEEHTFTPEAWARLTAPLLEWPATLADLPEPPVGIETVVPGQRIELLEDGKLVGLSEVIIEWTRGGPRVAWHDEEETGG